jgi:RNA polymerase sigma-70 factor (ECF subfamily)
MSLDGLLLSSEVGGVEEKKRNPSSMMTETQFEAFYRRTSGGLWSYLYRMTGDPSAADDLLQKTFFRFLRAGVTAMGEEHLRRSLYRTATNLALDYFRERKRERERSYGIKETVRADTPDLRHDMMRTFGELKPQERALLWLAHVEGSDHQEIAAALGLKSGSVRVLLFRARKRLGEILRRKGLAPEGTP